MGDGEKLGKWRDSVGSLCDSEHMAAVQYLSLDKESNTAVQASPSCKAIQAQHMPSKRAALTMSL